MNMLSQLPEDIFRDIMTEYCDFDDKISLLNTSKHFGKHRQSALNNEIHILMDLVYHTYILDNIKKLHMNSTNVLKILSSVFNNINFFLTYTPSRYFPKECDGEIDYTHIINTFKDTVKSHNNHQEFIRMSINDSIVSSVAMNLYH